MQNTFLLGYKSNTIAANMYMSSEKWKFKDLENRNLKRAIFKNSVCKPL